MPNDIKVYLKRPSGLAKDYKDFALSINDTCQCPREDQNFVTTCKITSSILGKGN